MNIPTMKVKPWGSDQGDFVVINEADFDPAVHTRFEAEGGAPHAAPRLDPAVMEELADGQAKMIAAFDHDGDGKPGGSLPKAKRAPKRKAKR